MQGIFRTLGTGEVENCRCDINPAHQCPGHDSGFLSRLIHHQRQPDSRLILRGLGPWEGGTIIGQVDDQRVVRMARLLQRLDQPSQPLIDSRNGLIILRQITTRVRIVRQKCGHDDLGWIARSMGFADCCAFLSELDAHRELVAQEFDTLLGGGEHELSIAVTVAPIEEYEAVFGKPCPYL